MISHNFNMRIGEMPLARHGFPIVLHNRRSVVAGVASGKLSGHGCSSRYGYRHVLGVFQRKFSQLYYDFLDSEGLQQMRRQPVGKCLDQICRLISHKILRFLGNDRVIDRVVDLVGHMALLVVWPERNADR